MKRKYLGLLFVILYLCLLPYMYNFLEKQFINEIGRCSIAIGRIAAQKIQNHIDEYVRFNEDIRVKMQSPKYDPEQECQQQWDNKKSIYSRLSEEFAALKAEFPSIKYLYTCDLVPGKKPFFVVLIDANLHGTPGHSHVGSKEEDVNQFSLQAFKDQTAQADKEFYYYGEWGHLLTAYVPIISNGKFYQCVGVDTDYKEIAPFLSMLKVWVMFSVILSVWFLFILFKTPCAVRKGE